MSSTARKAAGGSALALALLACFPVAMLFLAAAGTTQQANGAEALDNCLTPGAVAVPSLSKEQSANASVIVQTGVAHNVPTQGLVVAIATALQESTLHNYDYGDADSQGLFQQRPSQGWGSVEQVTNPQLAAEAFYGVAKHTSNSGLLDVAGWQNMPLWEAAQSVQASAFPSAYAAHEGAAVSIVNTVLNGSQAAQAVAPAACGGAMSCPPITGSAAAVEEGLTPDALIVARCVHQQFPTVPLLGVGERASNPDSDHPSGRAVDAMIGDWQHASGRARGDAIARYAQTHARAMGVNYIIWRARIWSVERAEEGWRPYAHPSGAADATSAHLDHVHVSVFGNAAVGPSTGKWTLPVAPGQYQLTARFGECGGLWTACHTGLDFDTSNDPANYPTVRAAASGRVTASFYDADAYGNLVQIDHGNGVQTWYAHLDAAQVQAGQVVQAGQTIGVAGGTGNTTGEHLHFEVRESGQAIDPEQWLEAHGVNP